MYQVSAYYGILYPIEYETAINSLLAVKYKELISSGEMSLTEGASSASSSSSASTRGGVAPFNSASRNVAFGDEPPMIGSTEFETLRKVEPMIDPLCHHDMIVMDKNSDIMATCILVFVDDMAIPGYEHNIPNHTGLCVDSKTLRRLEKNHHVAVSQMLDMYNYIIESVKELKSDEIKIKINKILFGWQFVSCLWDAASTNSSSSDYSGTEPDFGPLSKAEPSFEGREARPEPAPPQ
jgi:hypothetical protein